MRPRGLTVNVVAQLAFGLVAMTLSIPSMQDWPRIFGASQAAVQLTFSGYVAAYGGMQLLYGPLSDRLGRKPVLLTGLALAVAGSLLGCFASSLAMLVTARILQGAGAAACMVVGRALVQDHFSAQERTRVMALVGMTMGLCPPAATLLGGQLHVRWGWQSNFVLITVLAAALLIAAWRGLPETPRRVDAPHWRQLFSGYGRLLATPAFGWYAAVLAMTTASFYAFLSGAPLVLAHYGVTPDRIGWYLMTPPLAYIVGNLLTTRLIHRWGDRRLMQAGQAVTVGGILLTLGLALSGWHSPLALSLPLILLGIGHGLLVPPTLVGTVGLVPAFAGSAAAIAGVMQQAGGSLGSFVTGLVPHQGAANLAWLMLFWASCGWLALLRLHHVQRSAAVPQGAR